MWREYLDSTHMALLPTNQHCHCSNTIWMFTCSVELGGIASLDSKINFTWLVLAAGPGTDWHAQQGVGGTTVQESVWVATHVVTDRAGSQLLCFRPCYALPQWSFWHFKYVLQILPVPFSFDLPARKPTMAESWAGWGRAVICCSTVWESWP